jgi:endonuclease/exonuclease/phosphatase family metal-dependent hydrolase
MASNAQITKIVSLNVLYDPRIATESPHHFTNRWALIQEELQGADLILLQEVHVDFLPLVSEFADKSGYLLVHHLCHVPRQVHLATLIRRAQYLSHAVHHAPGTFSKALSATIDDGGAIYTIFNVHLPLDIKGTGERMAATSAFVRAAALTRNSVLIGDWNALPGNGDASQLECASSFGVVVPWDFLGFPPSTYWGFPQEKEELRGYSTFAILDRVYANRGVDVALAECRHKFVEIGGARMGISDHMPCHVHLRAPRT